MPACSWSLATSRYNVCLHWGRRCPAAALRSRPDAPPFLDAPPHPGRPFPLLRTRRQLSRSTRDPSVPGTAPAGRRCSTRDQPDGFSHLLGTHCTAFHDRSPSRVVPLDRLPRRRQQRPPETHTARTRTELEQTPEWMTWLVYAAGGVAGRGGGGGGPRQGQGKARAWTASCTGTRPKELYRSAVDALLRGGSCAPRAAPSLS